MSWRSVSVSRAVKPVISGTDSVRGTCLCGLRRYSTQITQSGARAGAGWLVRPMRHSHLSRLPCMSFASTKAVNRTGKWSDLIQRRRMGLVLLE